MKTKHNYYFPYVSNQSDFQKARTQIAKIYLETGALITPFDIDTETTIDWLTSVIRYSSYTKLESIIESVLIKRIDYRLISEPLLCVDCAIELMATRIESIRANFNCLKYFDEQSKFIKIDKQFKKNADSFLVQIGVWKPNNEFDDLSMYQREWENEYFLILSKGINCDSIFEFTDIYKYVWFYWILNDKLGKEKDKEIELIWDNKKLLFDMLENNKNDFEWI